MFYRDLLSPSIFATSVLSSCGRNFSSEYNIINEKGPRGSPLPVMQLLGLLFWPLCRSGTTTFALDFIRIQLAADVPNLPVALTWTRFRPNFEVAGIVIDESAGVKTRSHWNSSTATAPVYMWCCEDSTTKERESRFIFSDVYCRICGKIGY